MAGEADAGPRAASAMHDRRIDGPRERAVETFEDAARSAPRQREAPVSGAVEHGRPVWDFLQEVLERPGARRDPATVLAALSRLDVIRQYLDHAEYELIRSARIEHVTWGDIADSTGRGSAQAAEQRAQRLRAKRRD